MSLNPQGALGDHRERRPSNAPPPQCKVPDSNDRSLKHLAYAALQETGLSQPPSTRGQGSPHLQLPPRPQSVRTTSVERDSLDIQRSSSAPMVCRDDVRELIDERKIKRPVSRGASSSRNSASPEPGRVKRGRYVLQSPPLPPNPDEYELQSEGLSYSGKGKAPLYTPATIGSRQSAAHDQNIADSGNITNVPPAFVQPQAQSEQQVENPRWPTHTGLMSYDQPAAHPFTPSLQTQEAAYALSAPAQQSTASYLYSIP